MRQIQRVASDEADDSKTSRNEAQPNVKYAHQPCLHKYSVCVESCDYHITMEYFEANGQ